MSTNIIRMTYADLLTNNIATSVHITINYIMRWLTAHKLTLSSAGHDLLSFYKNTKHNMLSIIKEIYLDFLAWVFNIKRQILYYEGRK